MNIEYMKNLIYTFVGSMALVLLTGCSAEFENGTPEPWQREINPNENYEYTIKHPCLVNTEADFERARRKVNEGAEPWISGWQKLCDSRFAQLNYNSNPQEEIVRHSKGGNFNTAAFDAGAAYQLALRWKISGDEDYAKAAIKILNGWAKTCKGVNYKTWPDDSHRLLAHWDTRPWADNDPDEKNHNTPILGANDGASGVGALLEIARLVNQQQPELGIDIILLDAEDYGAPQFYTGQHKEEFWCLGSQYWARNPHVQGYNARFGILLDMVGGEGSVFMKEGYSEEFAPDINKKVWKAAKKIGNGKTFMDGNGGFVTDDHLFINRLARIKTIDIIPYNQEGDFTPTWHTVNDNMEHIDKNTLKAVGQTVLEVIYNEK